MAFQQPTLHRPSTHTVQSSQPQQQFIQRPAPVEDSQEWVLFSPTSQAESSTRRTATTRTAGLSRVSDFGSLNTAARSGQIGSSVLDEEEAAEDADLDSLDDGLHAFREPALYQTQTNQSHGAVLPAHDGLGTFQASSAPVLEQLWQHEQYNPKRKHEGHHRSASSVQRQLDIADELDAQASEEKRMRIEKWRVEQSQALMEEVERETRRRLRRESTLSDNQSKTIEDILGSTPTQRDYLSQRNQAEEGTENEPFWRRITRKFIRDIIGIDEPLLSVILGESLPGDCTPRPSSPAPLASIPETQQAEEVDDSTWRSRLLQRIARELGVYVHQLTPHPGAFTTYQQSNADYAGMPVHLAPEEQSDLPSNSEPTLPTEVFASSLTPNFPPTIRDPVHADSWGFDEEPAMSSSVDSILNIRKEREYWERELDVKMVFRYLADRFGNTTQSRTTAPSQAPTQDASARRAAIIRQHHPLVARAHRSPARLRRDSRLSLRRPSSSCASESAKGSRRASALRSGSSRNYWDLGASVGSGSIGASAGITGAWGEV